MDYSEAVEFINSRQQFSMDLKLERIEKLLENIGNPQKELKFVHIAGTNGKGSVCSFISSITRCAGYKTGLFSSPHLVDFRERFQIDGKNISKESIIRYLGILKKYLNNETYFEILTALGFLYFADNNCDIVVLESGLGHPLDATNVMIPLASVITNISYDHMHILGDTLEKIAYSKAGIIKQNIPVICGAEGKALEIIKSVCEEKNAELIIPEKKIIQTGMVGRFQQKNAEIASAVISVLREKGYNISEDNQSKGFRKAYWPGRMDFIEKNILCDCGHNQAGIKEVVDYLIDNKHQDCVVIFSCMKDKDIPSLTNELKRLSGDFILTKVSNERSASGKELNKHIPQGIIKESIPDAYDYAKKIANGRLITITGSIFLIGELYSFLGLNDKF